MPTKAKVKRPSSDRTNKGLLIVVEGVDGSGKSTQLELLQHWLDSNGFATVKTDWSSSETIRPLIKDIKNRETLISPETFSLLHLSDFAERHEKIIKDALKAGKIVLADRYVYTAYARDTARGLPLEWIRKLYNFAPVADLAIYFRVSPEVAIERKTKMPKFYESGADLKLSPNIKKSFDIFQRRVIAAYERLATQEKLQIIDGETEIYHTFPKVKKLVADLIQRKLGITVGQSY
ncbi:dTMP kinase [Candidatus Peregrinibacteria bacterium]|nr:dTMP kinase [Candidatus Peregrinibacteria bacterium]